MNKKLICIILCLAPLLASCGKEIQSSWNNGVIAVDGNSGDWKTFPQEYDNDLQILYSVINNDEFLNIMVSFNDMQIAGKISLHGFTLWFNGDNEKEKTLGVFYIDSAAKRGPMKIESEDFGKEDFRHDRSNFGKPPEMKGKFYLMKNDSETARVIAGEEAWKAAVSSSDGVYCFEYEIPLKKAGNSEYYLNIADKKEFKICISIGGLSEKEKDKLKGRIGGMRGQEGFGEGRGGGKGGGRGGMQGGQRQAPGLEGKDIWVTVLPARLEPINPK